MISTKCPHTACKSIQVATKSRSDLGTLVMKIDGTVVALAVEPERCEQSQLRQRRTDGPPERIDRAKAEHRSLPIPPCLAECLLAIGRWQRFKGPRRICPQLRRYSQATKDSL